MESRVTLFIEVTVTLCLLGWCVVYQCLSQTGGRVQTTVPTVGLAGGQRAALGDGTGGAGAGHAASALAAEKESVHAG